MATAFAAPPLDVLKNMKKAIILVIVGISCFGLGWLASWAKHAEDFALVLTMQQEIELQRVADKAFRAYQEEENEIGINRLNELLEEISFREESLVTESNKIIPIIFRVVTHARLSKLYEENGQLEESEFHKSKAIEFASEKKGLKGMFSDQRFDASLETFDARQIP